MNPPPETNEQFNALIQAILKGEQTMIYQATQAIADRFEEENYKFRISEEENTSRVIAGVTCDNTTIDIHFISSDDDNDVSVRVFRLVRFPEDKLDTILRVVNALNRQFRFARFIVDEEDRSVDIHHDIQSCTQDVGEAAVEMFCRLPNIADDAFPQLMKAIWGN